MGVETLFSVASLFCLTTVITAETLSVDFEPPNIVLEPGSVYQVSAFFLTKDLTRVGKLFLNGADDVCLSLDNAKNGMNNCDDKCSTTCIFHLNESSSIDFSMTYDADKNSVVIPSEKSITVNMEVEGAIIKIRPYDFTARDGRKVVIGFADPLHRLVTEDQVKLSIMRYGNQSLSIDKNLTIAITLWQSDDGENWEGPKALDKINKKLTESANWTVIVDNLDEDLFYKVDLTTSLSDIVELQPSVVKIYPTESKLQCGTLADSVRDLTRNHQVNETAVDNVLDQMCRLVREPISSAIDTTSEQTDSPAEQSTTTTESPVEESTTTTESPVEESTTTTESPVKESTTTTESPVEESTTTTESPVEESTTTTESPVEESTTTTESPETEQGQGNQDSQDEESTSDTVEESDSSMLWFAFLGLVAILLAVGVSGYLLFNHHAKVKVYLFQLVGKSGSSLSPSTIRRGKPSAAKYTPLPTNVRETMLHQD